MLGYAIVDTDEGEVELLSSLLSKQASHAPVLTGAVEAKVL